MSMLLSRTIFAGIFAGNRRSLCNSHLPIKYNTNPLVLYYNSDLVGDFADDIRDNSKSVAKSCHRLIEYYNDDLNSNERDNSLNESEKKQKQKCYKLAEYYNSDAR